MKRFPTAPVEGYDDDAAAVGLWEEHGDGVTPNSNRLLPKRVFVAGTVRSTRGNYIAVSRYDGKTGVATMVYRVFRELNTPLPPQNAVDLRHWAKGALWNRDQGLFDDRAVAARTIRAVDDFMPTGTSFLIYVAAKTKSATGFGYATLKYDGAAQGNPDFYKPLSWLPNSLPIYFGPGPGNHEPAGLAVEYSPGVPNVTAARRIWTTGTSLGGLSGTDWATQFINETMPE
ncbi:MAG: hypothetical protein KF678_06465 [Phycisphaeraceae bacterium]|nr:hypothetical protein [Phycisphaeraceae bacterium]